MTTEIVWRGNTVLPISPPAGSLLCPRSVVTNVFCHLTFAEQRETAGAWLARLCDPAPGQATVGSCCPRSHAPRAALMGPHSNQGHLKQDTSPRPATRQQCSSTATVVFKSGPCTLMISSLVERSPGWQQEVTSVLVLTMRGLLSVRTGLEAAEVHQVVSSSCPAQ